MWGLLTGKVHQCVWVCLCKSHEAPDPRDKQAQRAPVLLLTREAWPGQGGCGCGRAVAWPEPVPSWPHRTTSTQDLRRCWGPWGRPREWLSWYQTDVRISAGAPPCQESQDGWPFTKLTEVLLTCHPQRRVNHRSPRY